MEIAPIEPAGSLSILDSEQLLGKQDFLKLLVTQLKHQDPLSPMDNEQFIAQLTQMSSLEQLQNLSASMAQLVTTGQVADAGSLIGRDVSFFNTATGMIDTGIVTRVEVSGDAVALRVNDQSIPLADITAIAAAEPAQ